MPRPYAKVERTCSFPLREIRSKLGIPTLDALYELVDREVPFSTLSRFETGERMPDMRQALVICGKLGIPVEKAFQIHPPVKKRTAKI